jgi:hypothetical protein
VKTTHHSSLFLPNLRQQHRRKISQITEELSVLVIIIFIFSNILRAATTLFSHLDIDIDTIAVAQIKILINKQQ